MKITPTTVLVVVCLGLASIPLFMNAEPKKLELTDCNVEPIIETIVDIFIEDSAVENSSLEVITDKVQRDIRMSNVTLKNSCVPVKRRLGDIEVVTLPEYETLGDELRLHSRLFGALPLNKQLQFTTQPNRYYGFILDQYHYDTLGYTTPTLDGQFFVLHGDWQSYVLEHELSHLSMAKHQPKEAFNDEGPSILDKISSADYAHGETCGGMVTVGYSHYGFVNVIPSYSSPNTRYGKEVCGSDTANNAKQMTVYAQFIKDKMKAAPTWDIERLVAQTSNGLSVAELLDRSSLFSNSTWHCIDHIAPLYENIYYTYHSDGRLTIESTALILDANNQKTETLRSTTRGHWEYQGSTLKETVSSISVNPHAPILNELVSNTLEYNKENPEHSLTVEPLSNDLIRLKTPTRTHQLCKRVS